jgi:hypothetical protein
MPAKSTKSLIERMKSKTPPEATLGSDYTEPTDEELMQDLADEGRVYTPEEEAQLSRKRTRK